MHPDEERAQRRARRSQTGPRQSRRRNPLSDLGAGWRIGAVTVVAVAVGLIAWAIVGTGGGDNDRSSIRNAGGDAGSSPVALSDSGLKTILGVLRRPVYWVGPQRGSRYEYRQLANGVV